LAAKQKSTNKSKARQGKKNKHLGAKPLHTHDSAPPIHFRSEPGIHTELQSRNTNAAQAYDAKVWSANRESDPALKKPGDLLLTLAVSCAERVAGIVSWSRELAERTISLRASFSERFIILNNVYVLSAVHQKMQDLPDEEWDRGPFTRGSHCFGIQDVSVLSGLDRFCIEVLTSTLDWIFRWMGSITDRGPDCRPIKEVINDAVVQAGILNFNEWSHQFSFDVFQDADPFPGSGRLCLPKLLPDDYDVEDELQRVVIELMHEHKAAQGKVAENPSETKRAEGRTETSGSDAGGQASVKRKQIDSKQYRKSQRKSPPQLLKEARERQTAQEISQNPHITSPELGNILGCNKSTIVRLKAWKNRGCLDRESKPLGWKKTGESGSDIEAIAQ
jgi:hypothetical protein